VIGREFAHELLAAVADRPQANLNAALDQLVQSELIFRRGAPPEATYSFKHALVQDAAYQSLLKSKRQQLHARIATALEERFPDIAKTSPEVLARHLTEAGLMERAVRYWRCAGEVAAARSANMEAIAHLKKGLELVETLPDTPEHMGEELALQLAIGGPQMATKGYASGEVERTYSRAWAICQQLGRSEEERFPVRHGLWICYYLRGEFQRAHGLAEELVQLAHKQGRLRRAYACRALGSARFFLGRLADASEQFELGIALDAAVEDLGEHRAHALGHGEHPGVFCRMFLAWALWLLGYPNRALEMAKAGLHFSQNLALPHSIALGHALAAVLHNWRREFAVARDHAETGIEDARENHLRQVLGFATMARGAALVGLGQQAEGIAEIRTGLSDWNRTGARLSESQWLGLIAEAHLQAGQLDDARPALDEAAETTAATGECYYQAELYRLRGVALAATGDDAKAASWIQRAIDTARSQEARSLELRAATSLARLWAEQRERRKAHDFLVDKI
jgi:tetratricopeptide (TPR) repeat protein